MKNQSSKLKRKPTKMMKREIVKKAGVQTVDLAALDAEGSFPCPTCGTMISPDDETEEVYQIVDTKVVGEELMELIISCNTCGSTIRVTGFQQATEGLHSN
jgi:predicted RNA-binding Zn-ribbon protein involved in translation (DUF1610 family)